MKTFSVGVPSSGENGSEMKPFSGGVASSNSEIAHALDMHAIASARLRHREVDEHVLRAVRLWIALEDAVAAAPAPRQPPPTAHEPEGPTYEPRW